LLQINMKLQLSENKFQNQRQYEVRIKKSSNLIPKEFIKYKLKIKNYCKNNPNNLFEIIKNKSNPIIYNIAMEFIKINARKNNQLWNSKIGNELIKLANENKVKLEGLFFGYYL